MSAPAEIVGSADELRLQKALSAIRSAWIAGLVNVALTASMLGYWLLRNPTDWFHLLLLIDFAIILGLCFGVYRKSRVAAVLLLLFFVAGKAQQFLGGGPINGWPVALLFLFFFARGVVGTFVYHRLVAKGVQVQASVTSSPDGAAPVLSPPPNTASGARLGAMLGMGLGVGGFQVAYPFMAETMPWLVGNTDRALLAAVFAGLSTGLGTWIGRGFDRQARNQHPASTDKASKTRSPSSLVATPPSALSPGLSEPTATVMLSTTDFAPASRPIASQSDLHQSTTTADSAAAALAKTSLLGRRGEAIFLEMPRKGE